MENKLTLKEACKVLNKSSRTITRYISQGKLNPDKKQNNEGYYEYAFNPAEVNNLKDQATYHRTPGDIPPDTKGQEGFKDNKKGIKSSDTGHTTRQHKTTGEIQNKIQEHEKQIKDLQAQVKQLNKLLKKPQQDRPAADNYNKSDYLKEVNKKLDRKRKRYLTGKQLEDLQSIYKDND